MIPSNIPFRIKIGVTGHRQVVDQEKIEDKIRQNLDSIKDGTSEFFDKDSKKIIDSSPHTPIAFSILTPLAEGADRLVAREVLKFPDSRIEVVLPLVKEDYLEDFESPESRQEFEGLLGRARRPISLRKHRLREEFPSGDLAETRRQAYEDVGRYVVDHCDVLMAIWDEEPSRGKGGTAEIVDYARSKKRPVIIISPTSPYSTSVEIGHGVFVESIHNIEMFNTYDISERNQQTYISNMYNDLFENPEGEKLPEEAKRLVKEKLLPFYVLASTVAKKNQRFYRSVGSLVYFLSAAAIASVALGILFYSEAPSAFLVEFIILTIIFFSVTYANLKGTHKKWIESRFLAERIRSAIFFAVCGVETSPIDVPPYMRIAHQPDDWMVKTFDEIWGSFPKMKGCQAEHCRNFIEYVHNHWIKDQMTHHRNKHTDVKKISQILEWSGLAIFFMAMAAALSHLIFYRDRGFQSTGVENLLIFCAIVLPAVGAAIGGIRSHREYSRMEKRSKNMEVVLGDLDERFISITTPEALESLLREAEELMLRETQDWLMLMRFVELKPAA
jgi:hypothetical protein